MPIQTKNGEKISYIGNINSSSKLAKGLKKNVDTYGIYLAPHNLSSYQVCPNSTAECRRLCLFSSGRGAFDKKIPKARIIKTKMLFEETDLFIDTMRKEIHRAAKLAEKKGHDFAIRLNCTADISPQDFRGVDLLAEMPQYQWYDYTKSPSRLSLIEKYPNYHLTFSWDGFEKSWKTCEDFLNKGGNVAVVFEKELPKEFRGFEVIDGDLSDLRYLDKKGTVVGLVFKKIKGNPDISNSKFIIKT